MFASPARLPWIDHLRTLVILLVVNLHACVTYSHVGDWYAMSEREPTLAEKVPFIIWQGHLQSFFMGLLFFISGYFAYGSLSRRGAGAFVLERLIRLGAPTLLYMLLIHPFILLVLNPWQKDFGPPDAFYTNYLLSGQFVRSSGPLWFAFALLVFCLVFAAWHTLHSSRRSHSRCNYLTAVSPIMGAAPSITALWLFALGLAVGTFLVRLVQPIGTNVLNMQLCFFLQYVAFFIAGLLAARDGWMLRLANSPQARRAGWLALIGAPILLLTIILTGAMATSTLTVFFGGWHWQAFALAFWEQFAGVGLSLGLLALFSRRMNYEKPALRWLSDRAFAVYVLHAPILIALFLLYRALPQNTLLLVGLLTVTALLASYALADLVRRIPGLRAIL
jgi:peptidoglycan/LPS O-acetylase OafA/YrhL